MKLINKHLCISPFRNLWNTCHYQLCLDSKLDGFYMPTSYPFLISNIRSMNALLIRTAYSTRNTWHFTVIDLLWLEFFFNWIYQLKDPSIRKFYQWVTPSYLQSTHSTSLDINDNSLLFSTTIPKFVNKPSVTLQWVWFLHSHSMAFIIHVSQ